MKKAALYVLTAVAGLAAAGFAEQAIGSDNVVLFGCAGVCTLIGVVAIAFTGDKRKRGHD